MEMIVPQDHKYCGRCQQVKPLIEFHQSNIWCKACRRAYYATSKQRVRRKTDPNIAKSHHLETTYGISIDEYNEMFYDQMGLCAICKQPEAAMMNGNVKDLAVDHCHETGQVRGLLCTCCNMALGQLFEDPRRAKALLRYIEQRVLPLKQQKR